MQTGVQHEPNPTPLLPFDHHRFLCDFVARCDCSFCSKPFYLKSLGKRYSKQMGKKGKNQAIDMGLGTF